MPNVAMLINFNHFSTYAFESELLGILAPTQLHVPRTSIGRPPLYMELLYRVPAFAAKAIRALLHSKEIKNLPSYSPSYPTLSAFPPFQRSPCARSTI